MSHNSAVEIMAWMFGVGDELIRNLPRVEAKWRPKCIVTLKAVLGGMGSARLKAAMAFCPMWPLRDQPDWMSPSMAAEAFAFPEPNWAPKTVSDEPEKESCFSVVTWNSERKKSPFRPS